MMPQPKRVKFIQLSAAKNTENAKCIIDRIGFSIDGCHQFGVTVIDGSSLRAMSTVIVGFDDRKRAATTKRVCDVMNNAEVHDWLCVYRT